MRSVDVKKINSQNRHAYTRAIGDKFLFISMSIALYVSHISIQIKKMLLKVTIFNKMQLYQQTYTLACTHIGTVQQKQTK